MGMRRGMLGILWSRGGKKMAWRLRRYMKILCLDVYQGL